MLQHIPHASRPLLLTALLISLAAAHAGCVEARAESPPQQVRPQVHPNSLRATNSQVAPEVLPQTGKTTVSVVTGKSPTTPAGVKQGALKGDRMMYTTYFYTATEAVIHGYHEDTNVRIASLNGGGTIFSGKVGKGQTKLIRTGKGVFAFMADKKSTILVGTPSSCTVVGYWVRDVEGSFRSDHFYTQLPGRPNNNDVRVLVWAWEDAAVRVTNLSGDKALANKKLKAGEYVEIPYAQLQTMSNDVLEISADKKAVSVQVYYDEGFFVPASDGRTSGKLFRTYVGKITNGVNDLNLISYGAKANVQVKDLKTGESLWKGKLTGDKPHTLTLAGKLVEVTSDQEISVAPYEHYKQGGYAEHHFGGGIEGTGIENHFLLPTPGELWVFSYFDGNPVIVTDGITNRQIWKGTLNAGQTVGVHPGHGFYRVRSARGVSTMGGASQCGAEFSPAGGMFKVDEELFKVIKQIKAERIARAKAQGKTLSPSAASAPLSEDETNRARDYVRKNTNQKSISAEEIQQRSASMPTY